MSEVPLEQVFVSFLEIYLDKLRDLAADAPSSGAFHPKPDTDHG